MATAVQAGLRSDSRAGTDTVRRILVVDDSRLQRRILVGSLRKWGFRVDEAENAEAALALCATSPPDLVLSDWMMPGMSGPEFCRAFRELPRDGYGYFILLTSKNEKAEIARGLDAGADDFLTKPVNSGELRARIEAGLRILAMQRELSEKNRVISETLEELQSVYGRINQDLRQAREIQKSLVPELERSFGASRFSLLLKPCGHVGGDLVGLFSPGVNRVGFYGIDVSGHGVTSALMTARLAGYLSGTHFDQNVAMERVQYAFFGLKPPVEVARILNARLLADVGTDEYFTMVYGTVNLYDGTLRLVQCGHPHPLLLRADGSAEFLGGGGMPIGLLPDLVCDSFELGLKPGDRLLIYSDGITECPTADGGMLGREGLLDLVRAADPAHSGREFLDDLYWRMRETMPKGRRIEDDVSALLLEYNGV